MLVCTVLHAQAGGITGDIKGQLRVRARVSIAQKCQTITTLRRAAASELTASGWPLDRLVPLQHPAPHSRARVCLMWGKRKKEEC